MGHSRKEIRNAVKAMLINATGAGENVYSNRETSLWEAELPAILIYTRDESSEVRGTAGRNSIRTLQLQIDIKAMADDSVDDTLDDIANEVEALIEADLSLSGTAQSAILTSTELTLDASSETEKGVATLTYEIKYTE